MKCNSLVICNKRDTKWCPLKNLCKHYYPHKEKTLCKRNQGGCIDFSGIYHKCVCIPVNKYHKCRGILIPFPKSM